jgi:hypothetical protein
VIISEFLLTKGEGKGTLRRKLQFQPKNCRFFEKSANLFAKSVEGIEEFSAMYYNARKNKRSHS